MTVDPIRAHCYSERMLNPFHGIVNVIEIPDADAVSRDGLHWTLFVQGGPEEVLVDGRVQELEVPDVKFGTWSEADGLRRGPVRNAADYPFVDTIGRQLLEAVKHYAGQVPFALRDRCELWLLDEAGLPLVLLASAPDPSGLGNPPALTWRAGELAKRTFHAASFGAQEGSHSELVAKRVNAAAGPRRRLQWFQRCPDGSGIGLHGRNLLPAQPGRRLPREAFPELLLRESWPLPEDTRLISDFLDWQASWLLQLQSLKASTRARLERVASRSALEMAERHRLFPEVVDEVRVNAALVEARLRNAVAEPPAEQVPEETLHPFFNE